MIHVIQLAVKKESSSDFGGGEEGLQKITFQAETGACPEMREPSRIAACDRGARAVSSKPAHNEITLQARRE
jgi:hypothetical protein